MDLTQATIEATVDTLTITTPVPATTQTVVYNRSDLEAEKRRLLFQIEKDNETIASIQKDITDSQKKVGDLDTLLSQFQITEPII